MALDSVTQWARELVARGDFCVLDTETTGVESDDEIIELAILDSGSAVVLNTRIRPFKRVSPGALAIHGITDESLREGPTRAKSFAEHWPTIYSALRTFSTVVVYNAEFDSRMLRQSANKAGIVYFTSKHAEEIAKNACMDGDIDESAGADLTRPQHKRRWALPLEWRCLMKQYAEYHGEPGRYGTPAWQSLEKACMHMGVELRDEEKHSALGDARATLGLLKQLAATGALERPAREAVMRDAN